MCLMEVHRSEEREREPSEVRGLIGEAEEKISYEHLRWRGKQVAIMAFIVR